MKSFCFLVLLAALGSASLTSCAPSAAPSTKKNIVVTYSVLGSLVKELVADQFNVIVSMPNGLDVHEWEPSARDIEALNKASLIVRNGLGLEGGMEKSLQTAVNAGVPVFTASDHIAVRHVRAGEGIPTGDADQATGAEDPHLWLDPVRMKEILRALSLEVKTRFAVDLDTKAVELSAKLDALDAAIRADVAALPEQRRRLVTGHESLGYFADAYGFQLVGAVVPSLTTQAEVSASDMSKLKQIVVGKNVSVIFTELGTPGKVAQTLANELGLKVVEISTHALLADGSYFTFLRDLASRIVTALKD